MIHTYCSVEKSSPFPAHCFRYYRKRPRSGRSVAFWQPSIAKRSSSHHASVSAPCKSVSDKYPHPPDRYRNKCRKLPYRYMTLSWTPPYRPVPCVRAERHSDDCSSPDHPEYYSADTMRYACHHKHYIPDCQSSHVPDGSPCEQPTARVHKAEVSYADSQP